MSMTLNEYQEKSGVHAFYPDRGENIIYPVLGLNGEAGEVAEKLKKAIRDKPKNYTVQQVLFGSKFRLDMIKEVGDCIWYCARIAEELGFTLEDVAVANLEKLDSRAARGKLGGSGDNR